ncbi:ATP-binding protein [Phenylobacterium soli]|uniref:ATPase n=1 Tax=Phenylobacterium soli TaxID=2170551 RepID=A0A328AMG5_9CAUL|nr:ATP-binding protein [Phenylobacterium soli]RAK54078.1 ATPase [Phenylobacterium soli]
MILSKVAGLHIGSVETSSPAELKVLLDTDAPHDVAFNAGQPQGFPRLNGYVLVPNEAGAVVAVIGRMTMEPAPPGSASEREGRVPLPVSRRRLFVTPIGTLETRRLAGGATSYALKRGVGSYPAVGDAVALPTADQLRAVVEASGTDRRVQIGASRLALEAPVTIDPDKLFGRHLGVFGNTGSGKSCTVAGLIRWSIQAAAKGEKANARFIVLDPNGEYRNCFKDLRSLIDVEVFSAEPREGERPLRVPAWMWNGHEWAGVVEASPGAQRPVLMQALRQLRAAAINGADPEEPAGRVLIAGHLRALLDYLRAEHAQGVAALSNFPRFKAIHDNLEGFRTQLQLLLEAVDQEEDALFAAIETAIETVTGVRKRRTYDHQGEERVDRFQAADIEEVIIALADLVEHLPTSAIVSGPSEDMPSRFDPYRLPEAISFLATVQPGNMQQHMGGLDLRIRTLLNDTRITPIIAPDEDTSSLAEWLADIFGGNDGRGRISILDLSLVPADVLTTIVSVLGRLVFEAAQRHRRLSGVTMPTVLVLEEAHNFVQRAGADTEDGPSARCRQVFEKIAKEGRKFGVGLLLSSQRPAELAPTVVAQCNSFVLHRIVNDRDQELVARLAPDSTGALLKELPSLPTRQAILLGIATEIPLVFEVRPLAVAERPDAANPDFWAAWRNEREMKLDFPALAASWAE